MKTCRICNETKELDQFDKRKKANGDKVPVARCKACRREYKRDWLSKRPGATGLNKEEYLNSVRKPKLSPEEKQRQAKAKWDAWYEKTLLEGEQKRIALEQKGVKTCTCCSKEQSLSEFHVRHRKLRDGSRYKSYHGRCRTCRNKRAKIYRKEKPDIARAYKKTPKAKAERRERSRLKEIRKSHPAVPNWITTKHRKEIRAIYLHAADCRIITGEEYHVDHIIPLKGETVCGLHVPWNLQILPADVNISKSNKWEWGRMDQ